MKNIGKAGLWGLTLLARAARGVAHAVLWLVATAERIEATVEALAARTGHAVDAVYAPLWRDASRRA